MKAARRVPKGARLFFEGFYFFGGYGKMFLKICKISLKSVSITVNRFKRKAAL